MSKLLFCEMIIEKRENEDGTIGSELNNYPSQVQ